MRGVIASLVQRNRARITALLFSLSARYSAPCVWSIVRRHPATQRSYAEAGRHTIWRKRVCVVGVVVVGVAVVIDVEHIISVRAIRRAQPPVGKQDYLSLQPALRSIEALFVFVAPSPDESSALDDFVPPVSNPFRIKMKDLLGNIKKAQKCVAFHNGLILKPPALFVGFFVFRNADVVSCPADEVDVLCVRYKVIRYRGAVFRIEDFFIRSDFDGVVRKTQGFDDDFQPSFFALFFYNAHTYIIP